MSRAEPPTASEVQEFRVPPAPTLPSAFRDAAVDFYYNSWRLVPANVLWAVGLIITSFLASMWLPLVLLAAPLVGLPTAGIFRMAALIVRQESVSFWDVIAAWRRYPGTAMGGALVVVFAATALVLNIFIGVTSNSFLGWAIASIAVWSLLVLGAGVLCYWPLLVDPRREEASVRDRLRLAALMPLAFPIRLGLLTVVLAVLFVVSTIFFAALFTITAAYSALVACHYVLPATDRFEGRATVPVLD